MIYSIENEDDLKDLEVLEDLRSKAKQIRLVEKIGKQGFQFDIKELFELITTKLTETSRKIN